MRQFRYPTTALAFIEAIRQIVAQSPNLYLQEFEYVGADSQWPIHVIRYQPEQPCGHGLTSAGIHGDEPAGPWAVLEFLRVLTEQPEVAHNWALTILPLLNPFGFERRQRAGPQGVDLNRGHVHFAPVASVSSWINALHVVLGAQQFDFMLSLHEDVDQSEFYGYADELSAPVLGRELIDLMRQYFQISDADIIENVAADRGLLIGDHDGSLEDWLHHTGVPRILVPEVPGRSPKEVRVEASLQSIFYLLARMRAISGFV